MFAKISGVLAALMLDLAFIAFNDKIFSLDWLTLDRSSLMNVLISAVVFLLFVNKRNLRGFGEKFAETMMLLTAVVGRSCRCGALN